MNNNKYAEEYMTDLTRWRLNVAEGRQTWEYLQSDEECQNRPQTFVEKYWIGLPYESQIKEPTLTAKQAAINGFRFFRELQTEDGHWAGAYDGPMFITPGIIISSYIAGQKINPFQNKELIRYILNRADVDDGGWGLHFKGKSTVFGTALNYVTLRILGVDQDYPPMVKARNTLHKLGSATAIPSWGKFWLSALGVYDWDGMLPLLPEPWLLPEFIPFFPGNWWVHTRAVYLGMCHIYGLRKSMPLNDLTKSLRNELYTQDYDTINWKSQQLNVSDADRYIPLSFTLKMFNFVSNVYQKYHISSIRKKALDETLLQIHLEIENTNYLCLAPVNFAVNMLVMFYEHGPNSKWFIGMLNRREDAMWLCREGLAGTGTNGSQSWDTSLAVQSCIYSGIANLEENQNSMVKALDFLAVTQIKGNPRDMGRSYRNPTLGAWPFSTRDQSYTVSDTTSEALKAVIMLQNLNYINKHAVSKDMLCNAIDVLLPMQNTSGGFSSYEPIRGPLWLEMFNASEVFGNIMTEYAYPECTTSVILGLTEFTKKYPDYRSQEIKSSVDKAIKYLISCQYNDGSWFGSWGICFTYASMFALKGFASAGFTYENSEHVSKACEFLLKKQNEDGGWGESYSSCELGTYINHPDGSQVVNTAFALLGLMSARCPKPKQIKAGIELLMKRQRPNGEWLQEGIEGVFNKNWMYSKIYE
ncbi:Protostadienol synthase A [Smittium mucronatum]|uniref:Terpene cyclase/mutase family member n=1 Tax=Smittium mucronatum TaxID=133383 RepID=A0A1R0GQ38_9FUNG|nr:Protostadienol synthase A [Smittium mucronatum]